MKKRAEDTATTVLQTISFPISDDFYTDMTTFSTSTTFTSQLHSSLVCRVKNERLSSLIKTTKHYDAALTPNGPFSPRDEDDASRCEFASFAGVDLLSKYKIQ